MLPYSQRFILTFRITLVKTTECKRDLFNFSDVNLVSWTIISLMPGLEVVRHFLFAKNVCVHLMQASVTFCWCL